MAEPSTERQLLQEISTKIDKVIGILAIAGREQNEQVTILRPLNFDWSDIGMLVGLTPDAARMRFNSVKNGAGTGRTKRNSRLVTKGDK